MAKVIIIKTKTKFFIKILKEGWTALTEIPPSKIDLLSIPFSTFKKTPNSSQVENYETKCTANTLTVNAYILSFLVYTFDVISTIWTWNHILATN